MSVPGIRRLEMAKQGNQRHMVQVEHVLLVMMEA